MSGSWKTGITLSAALLLLGLVAAVFWNQEWRYNLPTPRPAHLQQVLLGATVALPDDLQALPREGAGGPVLLHFYNPACPCSRFVADHVRQLARQFQPAARVVAVLETDEDISTTLGVEIRHMGIAVIADRGGRLASACGVYSTPQAVVLNADSRLIYRGNYNLSRYCTAPGTEFARLALEAGIARHSPPVFPAAATLAYGCPLPEMEDTRP